MARTRTTKQVVIGRQMATGQLGEPLLPKRSALPAFASDALSSNAYATQEILLVLSLAGFAFFTYTPWVAAAVVLVFGVVVMSYRQNVRAYPSGGGDYEVVSSNLGRRPGVFVAAALLVDYTLTVAVSLSAAVANISSAAPSLVPYVVPMAVAMIGLLSVLHLRGIRAAGAVFALPVYLYIVCIFAMLIFAAIRFASGATITAESAGWTIEPDATISTGFALLFLLARAFAHGTTALTGVQAVSTGVPAFREPKARNAATTLLVLGVISMAMFIGITWLAIATGVKVAERNELLRGLPPGQEQKTVIVQVAQAVFTDFPVGALIVSFATALVLVLAANTAFNGFPVLGSILAADGYMPRQLKNRGDRLAFSNGILALAAAAAALIIVYRANVSQLIQLYILGVFVAFTMSQFGMVRHWTRLLRIETERRQRGRMQRSRVVNSVGFVLTGLVLVIVLATKFLQGAWIVCLVMPMLYGVMVAIRRHYDSVEEAMLTPTGTKLMLPSRVHAVVLVARIDAPTLRALRYARAQRPTTIEALHVDVAGGGARELAAEWDRRGIGVPLRLIASPYRELGRPVEEYLQRLRGTNPRDLVLVYIPAYRPEHWWGNLLHNQTALRLNNRLCNVPGVMVASVPQHDAESPEARADRPIS